jgi:DNA topoisomerase-1
MSVSIDGSRWKSDGSSMRTQNRFNHDSGSDSAKRSAHIAGLRYVNDRQAGIRRIRAGSGFRYVRSGGGSVKDSISLRRIRALAIPPAWSDVWICADPNGHLQASGRDARGRKQHRYHPRWREVRDENKYNRMISFGKALPKIRRRVQRDIRRQGLNRDKILAAVVRLLELSALRVGNEEYAANNKSYGLTTIRDRHATVNGSVIKFQFRGKNGKEQKVTIEHPILSRIVRKCQELPGQDLFQYVDGKGEVHDITSGDVNDYLAEITGQDFTAKDFRTWTGTVLAALALREFTPIVSKVRARRNIVRAIETVARRLGNTPTVCKKCYVHPVILESYLDGSLVTVLRKNTEREMRNSLKRLQPEEAAVVALLQQRLKATQGSKTQKGLSDNVLNKWRNVTARNSAKRH